MSVGSIANSIRGGVSAGAHKVSDYVTTLPGKVGNSIRCIVQDAKGSGSTTKHSRPTRTREYVAPRLTEGLKRLKGDALALRSACREHRKEIVEHSRALRDHENLRGHLDHLSESLAQLPTGTGRVQVLKWGDQLHAFAYHKGRVGALGLTNSARVDAKKLALKCGVELSREMDADALKKIVGERLEAVTKLVHERSNALDASRSSLDRDEKLGQEVQNWLSRGKTLLAERVGSLQMVDSKVAQLRSDREILSAFFNGIVLNGHDPDASHGILDSGKAYVVLKDGVLQIKSQTGRLANNQMPGRAYERGEKELIRLGLAHGVARTADSEVPGKHGMFMRDMSALKLALVQRASDIQDEIAGLQGKRAGMLESWRQERPECIPDEEGVPVADHAGNDSVVYKLDPEDSVDGTRKWSSLLVPSPLDGVIVDVRNEWSDSPEYQADNERAELVSTRDALARKFDQKALAYIDGASEEGGSARRRNSTVFTDSYSSDAGSDINDVTSSGAQTPVSGFTSYGTGAGAFDPASMTPGSTGTNTPEEADAKRGMGPTAFESMLRKRAEDIRTMRAFAATTHARDRNGE